MGTGTEAIDSCDPNCAAGRLYEVAVTVTFSQPVKVCVHGGQWFWTHASFDWPNGLPSAVSGANAPTNSVDFAQIKAQPPSPAPDPRRGAPATSPAHHLSRRNHPQAAKPGESQMITKTIFIA